MQSSRHPGSQDQVQEPRSNITLHVGSSSFSSQKPVLPRQPPEPVSRQFVTQKPLPRRIRRPTACLECRRRRRKCTGDVPCRTCRSFGTRCVFDPSRDKRSKEYFRNRVRQEVEEVLRSQFSETTSDLPLAQQRFAPQNYTSALSLHDAYGALCGAPVAQEWAMGPRQPGLRPASESIQQLVAVKLHTGFSRTVVCTTRCFMASGIKNIPWYPASLRLQQVELHTRALYQIPPHEIPDVSPLSTTYYKYLHTMVEQREQSIALASLVLGDGDPSIDLLFRPRGTSDPLNVSTWACEMVKQFMPFDFFTQLGYVFLISRLMRWNLCPTLQNYMLLPSIMRPTCAQRCIPHYPSADLQPLPVIREALVRGDRQLHKPVGNVGGAGTQGIKMHWPFGFEEAVVYDAVGGQLVLSRLFEAAAADEASWSCGVDFAQEISAADTGLFTTVNHNHGWEGLEADGPYTFSSHQYEKTAMATMHSHLIATP